MVTNQSGHDHAPVNSSSDAHHMVPNFLGPVNNLTSLEDLHFEPTLLNKNLFQVKLFVCLHQLIKPATNHNSDWVSLVGTAIDLRRTI